MAMKRTQEGDEAEFDNLFGDSGLGPCKEVRRACHSLYLDAVVS